MMSFSARRLRSACILSAAAVAALVIPGAASATRGVQCSGENVTGQGSSLQKLAQQKIWNPDFNTSKNKAACSGTQGSKAKPTVTYTSTGSGPGLESWGANKHAETNFSGTNAYIGTDEAPNKLQKEEIEKNGLKITLETIPVLQAAIAIIVHLPAKCTATSTSAKGRLVLNNVTLEKIFRGTIKKWSEIKDGGDELKGTGCVSTTTIGRVVREEGSGTTNILKKYMFLVNAGKVDGTKTWKELSEGAENTKWRKRKAASATSTSPTRAPTVNSLLQKAEQKRNASG
jgi:ABC-type phosphate transport system substrate-binding protein